MRKRLAIGPSSRRELFQVRQRAISQFWEDLSQVVTSWDAAGDEQLGRGSRSEPQCASLALRPYVRATTLRCLRTSRTDIPERKACSPDGAGIHCRARHLRRSMADGEYAGLRRDVRTRNHFHHGRQRREVSKPRLLYRITIWPLNKEKEIRMETKPTFEQAKLHKVTSATGFLGRSSNPSIARSGQFRPLS